MKDNQPHTNETSATSDQTRSRPSIEVSTLIRPHKPVLSAASPEDDPTGVRALLSALPGPDPMPEHLVARINASLAAEQAQRASTTSPASVTPLLARARRRPGRLLFGLAGAAAAVALIAAVAGNIFTVNQAVTISGTAALASDPGARVAGTAAPPGTADKSAADKSTAGLAAAQPVIQIRQSATRYTSTDFVTQARLLRGATFEPLQPQAEKSSDTGPATTTAGLKDCLSTLGAGAAQLVRADVAFYQGQPAVIIVATTNGIPQAYAVGRQCSPAGAAVLRSATPLP